MGFLLAIAGLFRNMLSPIIDRNIDQRSLSEVMTEAGKKFPADRARNPYHAQDELERRRQLGIRKHDA